MAIIALASAKHSPGVTTTALGVAALWPGRTILVEADPAGSDLRPTFYAGRVDAGKGVLELAIAARYGDLAQSFWPQLEALAPERSTLLGVGDVTQAAAAAELWEPAGHFLRELSDQGITSVVDVGRVGAAHMAHALLAAADLQVLVLRGDLPGIAAGRGALQVLKHYGEVAVVVVGPDRPYSHTKKDIEAVLECPVLATVAWQPRAARALLMNDKKVGSTLTRSLRGVCEQLDEFLQERTRLLTPLATMGEELSHG